MVHFCDIEHTRIQLQNGRTAPVGIYTNFASFLAYRIDLFIDTREFRSTNPTSSDFVESDVCHIIFTQPAPTTSKKSVEDSKGQTSTKIVNTCEEMFSSSITTFANYDIGLQCLRSTPFSSTRRTELINSLELAVQQYAYIDININSGGDDPVQLDLLSEFNRMKSATYQSDFDFQQDIIDTFRLMRDVHTLFVPSSCYYSFEFVQPFILNSRVNDDNIQELYVSGVIDMSGTDTTFFELYGFDPSAFIGYSVSRIDEQNAMEHFLNFCDAHSAQKDRSARFNDVLFQNSFENRLVLFGATPSSRSISWHLVHPVTGDDITFNIEWYLKYFPAFTSVNNFVSVCQLDGTQTLPEESTTQFASSDPYLNTLGITFDTSFQDLALERVDDSTAVLVIPNFISTFGYRTAISSMAVLYLEAIHTFTVDQILIDVSFNTGGIIFSGYGLAALLDPQLINFEDRNDFDVIHSQILDDAISFYWNDLTSTQRDQIVDKTLFEATLSGGAPANGDSWYNPGVEYTRGGKTSRYSSRLELVSDFTSGSDIVSDVVNSFEYVPLAPDNVIVLTDGSCASTCSFFVRTLRESQNIRAQIIGYGGIRGETLRGSQVPANVFPLSYFISLVEQLVPFGFTSDAMPVPLPIDSQFQFVYREAYVEDDDLGSYYQGPNRPYPVEFTPSPVDSIIQYWPENPSQGAGEEIWILSIQYFDGPVIYVDDYDYWYSSSDIIPNNGNDNVESDSLSSRITIPITLLLVSILLLC